MSTAISGTSSSPRKALADLVGRLVSAWNGRDAAGFAEAFTARAEYVTGAGRLLRGRRALRRLLTSATGPAIRLERRPSVRLHGDCASVRFHWRSRGRRAARRGIITFVAVFEKEWRIDRLQNTDA